ncbi:MAG: CAP domain-containing protein [Desulfovibrio sp.]|nr:CAP domain-containing protein [Desulfovibrio sp.]
MIAYDLYHWDDYLFGDPGTSQRGQRTRRTQAGRDPYDIPDIFTDEERHAVRLLNDIREQQGLAPLRFNAGSALQKAALTRAREISESFSHTRPDGSDCSSVLAEFGLSFRSTGENIACGKDIGPERVTKMWRTSSGHYRNMVEPTYKEVGLAAYRGKGGRVYWVQIFLTR